MLRNFQIICFSWPYLATNFPRIVSTKLQLIQRYLFPIFQHALIFEFVLPISIKPKSRESVCSHAFINEFRPLFSLLQQITIKDILSASPELRLSLSLSCTNQRRPNAPNASRRTNATSLVIRSWAVVRSVRVHSDVVVVSYCCHASKYDFPIEFLLLLSLGKGVLCIPPCAVFVGISVDVFTSVSVTNARVTLSSSEWL